MKKMKTKNKCLVTSLAIIAMLMMSLGVKAQTVHIGLDNGSLLTGVGPGNDSGWERGFGTLWRHEQLSLSMTASDRDKIEESGEIGYPSNVFAKHSVISGNSKDGQICIIGGRRPSFISVSLPKGYRITGYTIVLSNDLQGANFGGRFSSINDNDEQVNANRRYGTMRFYEVKRWKTNGTNSGTKNNPDYNPQERDRNTYNEDGDGYNANRVRNIEPGPNWDGSQIGSEGNEPGSGFIKQAVDGNGNGNILTTDDVGKEYTLTRTAQATGEVDENGIPLYDMGNQLYFRLVKDYCFYGITIKEFRIEFTAEGTFAADVVPETVGEATSCVASPFKTSKIDIGEMKERDKVSNNQNYRHYAFEYEQIKDLQAYNYLYQDNAYENGAPADVATNKNITPVQVDGKMLYALKSDTYFLETPIEIATSGNNKAPIGYRIVGALFTPLWGTATTGFNPGPYRLKIYNRDGSGLMRWKYDNDSGYLQTNDESYPQYIEISGENDTDLGKVIDIGLFNNDAVKFEIETTGDNATNTQALVQVTLLLQALDPYIDKMDIVCTDNKDVLHLTQSFTADDFSVSGGKFIFYVPEDYYNELLTFRFSDLYSKYGDETYYSGGSGNARYSFVRSPYFIMVDGDGDTGLYNNTNYSPDATYNNKVYTSTAGNIRFKFNNAEDLTSGGEGNEGDYLEETPFTVSAYLDTTDPGDPIAGTPANPNKDAEFIAVQLKASSATQRSGIYFVFTADETRWNIAPTTAWQHRFYAFYRMEIEVVARTFTPDFTLTKIYDTTCYEKDGADATDSMWGLTLDVSDTENGKKVQGYLTYQEIINAIQYGRPQIKYTEQSDVDAYNARLTGALNSTNPLTAEQARKYNAAITGARKKANDTLSEAEANAYNATLSGAKKLNDVKSPAVAPVLVDDDNAENGPTDMKQILYIDGTPLYAMLNSAQGSDVIDAEDLRTAIAKNSVIFLPENTTSTFDNIAYKTSTGTFRAGKDFVLTDKLPFFTPYDIQVDAANYATYKRERSGPNSNLVEYATLVLPFTLRVNGEGKHVNDPDDGYEFNIRKIVGIASPTTAQTGNNNYYSEGNFALISGTQTEANKPYMIEVTATPENNNYSFTASQKGSTIFATPYQKDANGKFVAGYKNFKGETDVPNNKDNGTLTNYGTYSGVTVPKGNNIYYFNKNKYVSSKTLADRYPNVFVRPFRSYFSPDNDVALYSKMIGFTIVYDLFSDDGGITTSLTETSKPRVMTITTGNCSMLITATQNVPVKITSINGLNVDSFNMNAGEQRQVNLPSGIYIVNNTKILVK